jgi:hypothetical protein
MEAMIIQAETAARSAWTGTQVREECMGRARGLLALSVLETKGFHQRLFLYIVVCLFSLLHKQERGKRDCRDSPSSCFGVNYSFKWYSLLICLISDLSCLRKKGTLGPTCLLQVRTLLLISSKHHTTAHLGLPAT